MLRPRRAPLTALRTAPPRAGTRVVLSALALLLALVQTLGAMHGVLHAPWRAAGVDAGWEVATSDRAAVRAVAEPSAKADKLDNVSWFGHESPGSLACQLFDQLAHGDILVAAFFAPPPPMPADAPACLGAAPLRIADAPSSRARDPPRTT